MSLEEIIRIADNGSQYTGPIDKTNEHNMRSIERFLVIKELAEEMQKNGKATAPKPKEEVKHKPTPRKRAAKKKAK